MCFLYLECKPEKDWCGWYLFNFKSQKTVEKTYLETIQQQTNHRSSFQMLKCFREGNNYVFRLSH